MHARVEATRIDRPVRQVCVATHSRDHSGIDHITPTVIDGHR